MAVVAKRQINVKAWSPARPAAEGETEVIEAALVFRQVDDETVRCTLCAREADYATVFKAGSVFCSIECADAVAGLYLG